MKFGIGMKCRAIKIIALKKSIQLAKSFNIPKRDFMKRRAAKKSRSFRFGSAPILKSRIIAAKRSIPPNILISMFFK
ncbi:hypothetical protein HOC29_00295 [archaeon]|jgi:hypothetical protein|nr:hypothetical protein [archaeon]